MFRRTLIQAAAALACAAAIPSAFAFAEGTDYVALSAPLPGGEGKLVKVWSYDCPFCYRYDKGVVPILKEKLGKELTFKDYHLHTKGKYGNQGDDVLAVLWVEDEAAGRDPTDEGSLHKKAKFALYQAYHDKKERWDAGEDAFLKTALDAAGMSRADFDQKKNDPKVQALVKSWKDCTYDVAKVQGVPAFVVNGKYLLKTASITSIDSMVDNIRELSKK